MSKQKKNDDHVEIPMKGGHGDPVRLEKELRRIGNAVHAAGAKGKGK